MSASIAYRVLFVIPSALPVIPSEVEESLHHCPEGRALRPFIWERGGAGSSSAPTLASVPVTIGKSVLSIPAGSKTHIAGIESPMYGVLNDVEIDNSPNISMNHLGAVVALKIANNTSGVIEINDIEFKTQEAPLTGNFKADLTKIDEDGKIQSPYIDTKDEDNDGKKDDILSPFTPVDKQTSTSVKIDCLETQIQADQSATFYFSVCPSVHKINTFTILVNGSEKVPQSTEYVTFESGKVTTLRLDISELADIETNAFTYTFAGRVYLGSSDANDIPVLSLHNVTKSTNEKGEEVDNYTPINEHTATVKINNVDVPIYVLGDGKTDVIRIQGKGSDLVNVLPVTFYASRWDNLPTAMRLKKIDVYWPGPLGSSWISSSAYSKIAEKLELNLSDGLTPEFLAGLGFGTSRLTFSGMINNYSFSKNNVLVIDEDRTGKKFENTPGGNIETYLKIAGEDATIQGLIDIFNGKSSTPADKTATTLYNFMKQKIDTKLGGGLAAMISTPIVLGALGLTGASDLKSKLKSAQFYIEVETCPYPNSTDQNPIVVWGMHINKKGQ